MNSTDLSVVDSLFIDWEYDFNGVIYEIDQFYYMFPSEITFSDSALLGYKQSDQLAISFEYLSTPDSVLFMLQDLSQFTPIDSSRYLFDDGGDITHLKMARLGELVVFLK